MDRRVIREFTHKADNFLTLENSTYKQWVFRYTFLELEKDLGVKGDITTNSIFRGEKRATAKIMAKGDGVIAGREEIQYFLVDADAQFRPSIKGEFEVKFLVEDGAEFKKGDTLVEISGDVHDLLAIERVTVNLLMRMSAVATFTRKIVGILKDEDVLITPTRKSLWGLLDKKACVVGGGGTHRLGLYDAILVKDTHLDLIDRDLDLALSNIVASNFGGRFVEIEVESVEESVKAAEAFYRFLGDKLRTVGVLLMDNMSSEQIGEAINELKAKNLFDKLLFEASGGINEETVLDYAKTGVDIISMGCLTAGVKGVDMSMKIA